MNILCFGDSNTWGLIPMVGTRYGFYDRWTNIAGSLLSEDEDLNVDVNIIEEGLNGRTADEVDRDEPFLNGRSYMTACVLSHRPVDVLIVMLGTNDVKFRYKKSAGEIAESIRRLVRDMEALLSVTQMERVKVLLISPKRLDDRVLTDASFDEDAVKKSVELGPLLYKYADKEGWTFLDADVDEVTLGDDGLHLSADGHRNLGRLVYEKIKEL